MSKTRYKDFQELKELLTKGYGFEVQFEKRQEHKTRFSNEVTFIDVWSSKKGITLGVYNPDTKQITFSKPESLEEAERAIVG